MHRAGLRDSTAGWFRIVICLLIGLMQWLGLESAWPSELSSPAAPRAATDTFQRQSPPLPGGVLDAITPPMKTPSGSAALTTPLLSSALGLNVGNLMKSLPGSGSQAPLPALDLSELVNKARAVQLASAAPTAGLGAPRAAQSTPRSVAAPNTTPSAPTVQLGGAADPTDPYIVAQAQALNSDPNQIFAFVRDHIGYEAYSGSLRGARGALWSKAGNSLDRASLLVALLRAAGSTARYVQGTLPETLARNLILSMFQGRYRVLGCPPSGSPQADPGNDASLLAIAEDHYWVQYAPGAGGTFTDADPSFPGAQPGQTFGSAAATFADVPANLQHTVAFEIDAETYSQAGAAFGLGGGLSTSAVLTTSFATTDLVGKPVTIGQFVNSNSFGFILTETTNTYSPYLLVGQDAGDPSTDVLVRGTDFQEVFTNFPLGSSVLTGLFVHVTVTTPAGVARTYDKTLFDRIGFAARNGSAVQISVSPGTDPSLGANDLTTFNVLPSFQDESVVSAYSAAYDSRLTTLQALAPQLTDSATPTPAETALRQEAGNLSRDLMVLTERALTATFARSSDLLGQRFGSLWDLRAYFDSPRLLVASSRIGDNGTGTRTIQFHFDLLKDDIHVVSPPLQTPTAAIAFRLNRGAAESLTEGKLLAQFAASQTPGPNVSVQVAVSATDVLQAAKDQGIGTTVLAQGTISRLDSLAISAEAKARITAAISAGQVVMVPTQAVPINGAPQIAWLEMHPDGTLDGVLEDGSHGGVFEEVVSYVETLLLATSERDAMNFLIGFLTGWIAGELVILGTLWVSDVKIEPGPQEFFSIVWTEFINFIIADSFALIATDWFFLDGFRLGLFAAQFGYLVYRAFDPPLPASLVGGSAPPPPAAGASPGVTVQVVPDSFYTVPLGNAQVPTAFRALIRNTGPAADTFDLALSNAPAGFTLETSLPSVTIPAGAEAEIGVCAIPSGTLPAPGSNASLRLDVTSATAPAVTAGTTYDFTGPPVAGVTLTPQSTSLSTRPGVAVSSPFTIQNAGNVSLTVTTTPSLSPELSIAGLSSPITVDPGQSALQVLTFTPDATAAIGSPLLASLDVLFGSASAGEFADAQFQVLVQPAAAKPASDGAVAASELGRGDIAATLSNLAGSITGLAGNPGNAADEAAVLAYLDNLILEMNAPFLADFVAQLQAARDTIASSTAANVTDALNQLASVLASLDTVLSSPVAFPFDFSLAPNSALALPGQPAAFKVLLQNNSSATNTYDLSLGSLPSGISGGLNVSSVTLPPGGNTLATSPGNPVVTLTESASSIVPAQFTITASIAGLSGSARSTTGTLTVENEFLAVTSVKATPGIANAGDMVDVTAQLANMVNEPKAVNVSLAVKNSAGTVLLTPPQQSVQLSIQTLVTTVDFGQISTQGLANGDYTLLVTVADPTTGQPLPGGTGTGTLLVGLPVSATLSVNPTVLPPGNGAVTTTLTVNGPGSAITGSPFSLLGNVATASPGESLALDGTLAYVCDDNEISVTDVTDPAHPALLGTAAATSLKNDGLVHCSIRSGKLVAFADANSSLVGNNPVFLYFDISNPTQPSFVHATSISKRFFAEPVYVGNTAFVPTTAVFFFPGDGIIDQRGDLVAVDLTDFNNPLVVGTLEQGQPNFDATFGGHHPVFGAAQLDNQTLLVGTTSASGGGASLNTGVGQLLIVDVSNPAAMSTVKSVDVPGTVHLYKPIIQGNLAIALGSAGGYHVPCCTADNGPIVVATFDITDPHNPVLLTTMTTNLNPANGGGLAPIGNNLFLFAGIQNSSNQQVLLQVDTADPRNPSIQTFPIATQVNRMVPVGTVLYTVGPNGLTTYSIPGVSGTQYSATVQIDKNGTVAYDPTSFSVAPTSITTGSGFDTVSWLNPGNTTITWNSNVTGIEPGQVVPVAEGGTVSFKTALGSGAITLPQVSVTSDQILGLSPAAQTVQPGQLAPYVVTVKNPTAASIIYTLAVEGVSSSWATLQSSVAVPASGQISVPLDLRSELGAAVGSYGFVVTASAPGGVQGSVEGTLTLEGTADIGQPVSTTALGVSVTLVPTLGTAGQGTTATFGVQITNAGNTTDTYNLSASLPSGVSGVFDQTSVQVPPGLSNFRQVNLRLTPSPGTAPGNQGFTVTAVSATNQSVQGQATGTLTIAASGVSVAVTPPSAGPGSTFQMTVTNTGQAQDTFDLSLGGPAAAVASLGSTAVTLGPGASQVVSITVGAITFADPGSLALTAVATSRANTAVRASATAAVSIGATAGMTAEFSPATTNLPSPGAATVLLLVHNTGNTEDAYTGVIAGTSGPVGATLTGLDGQPTQTIPAFRLPGLSTGAIALNANLSAPGQGTVTVRVTSLTNGAITSAPSALVQTPTGTVVITTQASTNATNVALGTSVSDTATVSAAGGGPTPTGTVTFFLCSPSQVTPAGCPAPAGTQVGTAKTLDANGVTSSDATNGTNTPGRYCWRAEYSGGGNYGAASHTDPTQECFTVVGPKLGIQKTPKGGTYALGDTVAFTIVVTNNGPGTATAITLDDLLPGEPADLNWGISQPPSQGSCAVSGTQGSQTLHCTLGDLAEKSSLTVVVASATGVTDAADCLPAPGIANVRAAASGPGTGALGAVACATNASNAASGTTPAGCVADTGSLFCGCPDANPLLGIAGACAVLQGGGTARQPFTFQVSGPPGGVEGNICVGPGSHLHASGTSPVIDGTVLLDRGAGSLPAATCSTSNPNISCPAGTSDLAAQIEACAIAASDAASQKCTMGTDYSQSLTALGSGPRNNLTISGSGDEVLCVSDVILTGGTFLQLTGLPGTTFVINVKAGGTFVVSGKSKIKVDGTNVTAGHVLYNVMGAGHSVQMTGQSEIDGSVLAVGRDVQVSSPSVVNGTLCGGQNIQLSGGAEICPQ